MVWNQDSLNGRIFVRHTKQFEAKRKETTRESFGTTHTGDFFMWTSYCAGDSDDEFFSTPTIRPGHNISNKTKNFLNWINKSNEQFLFRPLKNAHHDNKNIQMKSTLKETWEIIRQNILLIFSRRLAIARNIWVMNSFLRRKIVRGAPS